LCDPPAARLWFIVFAAQFDAKTESALNPATNRFKANVVTLITRCHATKVAKPEKKEPPPIVKFGGGSVVNDDD
jgi:hypothetical protein